VTPYPARRRADAFDTLLLVIFLGGLYLGYSPQLAAGVPLPCAPAGLAGLVMLLRNMRSAQERQLFALVAVIGIYFITILVAPDVSFLGKRFTGLVQLSYSLIIGYGAWLTMMLYDRDRLARPFFWFSCAILVGCFLELYAGFDVVSDAVRNALFSENLYEATLRDEMLYGGIRPKLFTTEPSYVAFAFTVFAFIWYVLTNMPHKTLAYAALLAAAMVLMRSPTIVLGFVLIAPYQLLIAGRSIRGAVRSADIMLITITAVTAGALIAAVLAGSHFFATRVEEIVSGNDPSFFSRIIGPFSVTIDTLMRHPLAGAGLTGEPFIAERVFHIYYTAPTYDPRWRIDIVSHVLTNYFFLHWIYLGVFWGVVALWAVTRFLRTLYVPSIMFCWLVWAIMGQSLGAYVSPKPWAVLILAAAAALLHYRQPGPLRRAARTAPVPPMRVEPQLRSRKQAP
jgi:hypothetical protein